MTSPKHLWSGDWRRESEAADVSTTPHEHRPLPPLDEPTRVQASPPPPPPPRPSAPQADAPPPRTSRGGRVAAVAAVAVLLVGGAFAAGALINDDGDGSGGGVSTTAALPAVSSAPITPQKGETREAAIYRKASPAVVSIKTSEGSGTGFLINDNGTIVTNAHVVDTFKHVTVAFGAEGKSIDGTVKGVDPSSDLAVVSIPASDIPSGTTPLALADSSKVNVGDEVIAIGNPFGLDRTETSGIISGLARNIQAPNGYTISEALQTDAAINPGNSGGPLLNSSAEVVGVNSQIETGGGSSGNVGIGFAVSSNTVRQVVPALEQGKKVEHPWLGVSIGATASGNGALIASVTAGGPAAAAGIQTGDVVTSIDGKSVDDSTDLAVIVNSERVGQKINVKLKRGGQEKTVSVTVGTRPQAAPSSSSSVTPGSP